MSSNPSNIARQEEDGPLERAKPLVHKERKNEYGHPLDDFTRIAGMWTAAFGWKVEPKDIPLAMIMVKVSRLRQSPNHDDSLTDIVGYAETSHMCKERERGA